MHRVALHSEVIGRSRVPGEEKLRVTCDVWPREFSPSVLRDFKGSSILPWAGLRFGSLKMVS